MADDDDPYVEPTSKREWKARIETEEKLLEGGPGAVDLAGRDFAVEGNDTRAYVGADPEYRNYANETERPSFAPQGPEREFEARHVNASDAAQMRRRDEFDGEVKTNTSGAPAPMIQTDLVRKFAEVSRSDEQGSDEQSSEDSTSDDGGDPESEDAAPPAPSTPAPAPAPTPRRPAAKSTSRS